MVHESPSSFIQDRGTLQQRIDDLVVRNARFGAGIRLLLAVTSTTVAFVFGISGSSYLIPFVLWYFVLTLISATILWLVWRYRSVALKHFWLMPLLDIPLIAIERWYFVPHAKMPGGVGFLAVLFFLTYIALSLFSLNRMIILVTTATSMMAGLALLLRTHVVMVLVPMSMLSLALVGIASYKALEHLSRLLESEADKSQELLRLLRHLEDARETERSKVAHDLHDELGEQLSALGFALGLLRKRVRPGTIGIAANITELERLLAQTCTTVRSIVTDLRPPALDELGLKEALAFQSRRIKERSGLEVHFSFHGDENRIPSAYATVAFRVVQESLTNVIRHAEATAVDLSIDIDETLSLTVRDDGHGFDPTVRARGAGLLGMRERVLALGGELKVQSKKGNGTTVHVTLPLSQVTSVSPEEGALS